MTPASLVEKSSPPTGALSWKTSLAAVLAAAFVALLLKATVNHDFATRSLYTGDPFENSSIIAAENFRRFGFLKLKFEPAVNRVPPGADAGALEFYTHYPPLAQLLTAVAYVAGGGSVFVARLLFAVLTLIGILFASLSARKFALAFAPRDDAAAGTAATLAALLLSCSPGVLCFGDTLNIEPLIETLQWATLFFSMRFVQAPSARRLAGVAALCALHVWCAFDWIVPLFLILGFCLYRAYGTPLRAWGPYAALYGLGFALPVGLRVLQNSWALGGVHSASHDLLAQAVYRFAGGGAFPWLPGKHAGRLAIGLLWFGGLAAPLLAFRKAGEQFRRCRAADPRMMTLLILWGLGSLSWQVLMPQSAMIHVFGAMHPANFLILWGAIAGALLWRSNPLWLGGAVAAQLLLGGALFMTEIALPFLHDSSRSLAEATCAQDRNGLRVQEMSSSISRLVESQSSLAPASAPCGAKSAAAKAVLKGYLHLLPMSNLACETADVRCP